MTRARVFGIPLDLLSFSESVEACVRLVEQRRFAQHAVINAGKVVQMEDDPGLRDSIAKADIVNADGAGVVWGCRLVGVDVPQRVTGIDLMGALLEVARDKRWPVYLLGARPEVVARAAEVLAEKYAPLQIAGFADGYFSDAAAAADAVKGSAARIVFLGFSSPQKERFVDEQRERLGPVLAFGVGGAFDIIAGETTRAPLWMQEAGLEWLYRFVQEPRRMWRRYLVGNARFAALVAREAWRRRRETRASRLP